MNEKSISNFEREMRRLEDHFGAVMKSINAGKLASIYGERTTSGIIRSIAFTALSFHELATELFVIVGELMKRIPDDDDEVFCENPYGNEDDEEEDENDER